MLISGFLYPMAGSYGVRLFGIFDLPDPIPSSPLLASAAKWAHVASAMLLLLPLGTTRTSSWVITLELKDRLIDRMLPVRSSPPKN